jgi:hypothetical protein
MNGSHVNVYHDSCTDEWVCEFFTTLKDGTKVPRAIRCKTKDGLVKRMGQVNMNT